MGNLTESREWRRLEMHVDRARLIVDDPICQRLDALLARLRAGRPPEEVAAEARERRASFRVIEGGGDAE
jgi:hypothetical protein